MAKQKSDRRLTWKAFLLSHTADDLLMVAGNQRLYHRHQPISLHWLDRVSLLLIRQAYVQGESLALCYPVPTCNLSTLAAAQLLIYDFVQNRPGNLSILLISPRIEVRRNYLNLMIESEPLACALPLARLRAAGQPALVPVSGRKSSRHPRLYHLLRPHLLDNRWPSGIGAVIVDHTKPTFNDLTEQIHEQAARRDISSVIHLCTNPFADFIEDLIATDVPVWVWDHYGLASEFREQIVADNDNPQHPFGVSARQFRNIAVGIRHHNLICRHSAFEAAARRMWDDLATVQRTFSGRRGVGIHRAIRAAYGTFYTMLQMLVPLPVYEEEARNQWGIRPVSRRISDLEAFTPLLRDEAPDLVEIYWPSLILDLKEMQEALAAGNPKYETLVEQIHEHQEQQQKKLVIVCPNRATKRMLQLCLRAREGLRLSESVEQDEERLVRLMTYKALSTLASTDTLLLPGQLSLGRRQYALTAAAPVIRYLAYGDEADRIEQQIAATHQSLVELTGAEKREHVWDRLTPLKWNVKLPEADRQASTLTIEFTRSEGKCVSQRTVTASREPDMSLWTPFSNPEYDVVRGQDTLSSDHEENLRPSEFADASRQNVRVPALHIRFVDGFCYAEPDSRMKAFLPATGKTDQRRADGLRPEDVVVFVDGGQRRQLYDAILERVENHPAMGTTYILVRYWQQAVREGFFRSGMTYGEFLRKLQSYGSQMKTEPGVRCWITGDVLGPRDAKDIWRVGQVFDDEALIEEWKRINRALRRIRGLHISLARKLNNIIVQAGLKGRHTEAAEECIDSELNLYVDDFRGSVTVHRVTSVDQETKLVPYVLTGRFFEEGTEIKW